MKFRAVPVEVAGARARCGEVDALAAAVAVRDRARKDLHSAIDGVTAAREGRDREIARGVTEGTFGELDAWMRVAKKRVVDAELALVATEKGIAEARVRVDEGLSRVRQMEKLKERVEKEARVKEGRRELRAADEALARRATTK